MLLDENVNRRPKRDFAEEHEVSTVAEARWAAKKNGELLRLAEERARGVIPTRTSRRS